MSHIWYHADRHEQWEESGIVSFCCEGPTTGASAENMCPDQSQAFKEVNNSQAFTVGRKKLRVPIFFSGRGASRCSKARLFVQSFAQIFEELTA